MMHLTETELVGATRERIGMTLLSVVGVRLTLRSWT
jgi:hypothetical protein